VTIFQEEDPVFKEETMVYMKYVKHLCPETKRIHFHVFVQYGVKQRGTAVKRDFDGHLIRLFKNNTDYIDDGHSALSDPVEYGKLQQQGARNDINAFRDAIASGATLKDLSHDYFKEWLKYGKMIPTYRMLQAPLYLAKYPPESFLVAPITVWTKHYHLWGDPDTGKTQYALSQFKNPHYVRHQDHLADFDTARHDGIVCDEMSFTHWPVNSVIGLLNKKDPAQVHVRYTTALLPAGIKIIFCSNDEDIFYNMNSPGITMTQIASIQAKVETLHVNKRMF